MEGHYCTTHQTVFFKKGKMKGYAHPITDAEGQTIGWCNEGDVEKLKDLPPQEPEILPEHQAVIEEAMEEGYKKMAETNTQTPPNRAEGASRGMICNNIFALITASGGFDLLIKVFGKKIGKRMAEWARGEALAISKIEYDGKDLPKWEE